MSKKSKKLDQPSLLPPSQPLPIWSLTSDTTGSLTTSIDPVMPLHTLLLEPYDESKQLLAPRGIELRSLLEEDERLSAAYTGELGRLQNELNKKTKDTTDMVKYLEAEVRRKDLMS